MTEKITYIAEDGTTFDSKDACIFHENHLKYEQGEITKDLILFYFNAQEACHKCAFKTECDKIERLADENLCNIIRNQFEHHIV